MRLSILLLACMACSSSPNTVVPDAEEFPIFDAPGFQPPVPAGCVDDVTAGDHVYTCGTLRVDARIPAACLTAPCGLILELHGDTGTGLLMDGHTRLRDLGAQHNYIVVAPTGPPYGGQPGSTWSSANDATLVGITNNVASVFHVNAARIHVTGFSRGAFVTWRLICDHSDLFASAAPGGAGDGTNFGEVTCFSQGRAPAHPIPILFLMGRTDASVGYASLTQIRDAAIANYGLTGPAMYPNDANASRNVWSSASGPTVIETWDHAYETVNDGPFASAKGHCIPGSITDPYAAQYAIPCKLPTSFVWGDEVMSFFQQHPRLVPPGI
jgi:poly(3-hydroxybutyrate) depolymerase